MSLDDLQVFATLQWAEDAVPLIGRAVARHDVDLGTALGVFFCGAPERFNYVPRRDVPADLCATARLLDNICQRINSGFYLPQPGREVVCFPRLERWLGFQGDDRTEARSGRYVLDETIIAPLLDPAWCAAPEPLRPRDRKRVLWRAVLAPLGDLAPVRMFREREK